MIEQPLAGVDDLEDVSPHCRRIEYLSLDLTPDEALTVRQILAVYHNRNDDDAEHMAHVGNALRKLRFALRENQ